MTDAMTLECFLEQAEQGESVTEKLKTGKHVQFQIHHPNQETVAKINEILGKVIAANPDIAQAAEEGAEIKIQDPSVVVEMKQIDSVALIGCIRELDENNVSAVLSKLDPNGKVIAKCRELCGLTGMRRDDPGN